MFKKILIVTFLLFLVTARAHATIHEEEIGETVHNETMIIGEIYI